MMPAWLTRLFPAKPRNRATASGVQRGYAGAKGGRLMASLSAPATSSDAELYSALATLRNRSRALVRDVVYAKRARQVVINNIIGAGIGLQGNVSSTRGTPRQTLNDGIESAWQEWSRAEHCHTGGGLHFSDLERMLIGEVFTAGEVFIRLHPQKFGASRVPLALEVIEAERLADDCEIHAPAGAQITMGIEHDAFGRPLAYYVYARHPRELLTTRGQRHNEILRIPADQILHLRLIDRWPQTRGEPWLHAAITRLNQLGEFEEAALVAARIGAEKAMLLRETDEGALAETLKDGTENDGTYTWTSSKGQIDILPKGTEAVDWSPAYPDQNFDAFTRAFLRGIAAGVGVSYESLSRDYSQSNYSSSRLALIDDRDLWRTLQQWYIRAFREPLHRQWLQAAVLAGAVPVAVEEYALATARYEAARFKPRGWSWVDPTKEVNAYKEAIKAGFTTVEKVISMTGDGMDLEDVLSGRRRELDQMAELGLDFDTDPQAYMTPAAPAPAAAQEDTEDQPVQPGRVYAFKRDNE